MTKSRHILHIAKRRFISAKEIAQNNTGNKFIGALPPHIITTVLPENRGKITAKADKVFSGFARSISYIQVDSKIHYSFNEIYFKEYIHPVISELNNIFDTNNITMSYIGSGAYKHCFLLDFNQNPANRYVLQTFQNIVNFNDSHGALSEPQNYFTVYKQYSHGRIAKPFMARPSSSEFLPDGYILTKYIDIQHAYKKPLGKIIQRRTRTKSTDNMMGHNSVRGIIIDTGGFIQNPEHIAAQNIRKNWYKLAQILDPMNCYETNGTILTQLYVASQYRKYGDRLFDPTLWSKITRHFHEQQQSKTVQNILKSLKKLKDKCDQLQQNDNWEQIQKYITNDAKETFQKQFYSEIICKILNSHNR